MTGPGGTVWKADGSKRRQGFAAVVDADRPPVAESAIAAAAAGGVWVATQAAGLFHIDDGGTSKIANAGASVGYPTYSS